MNHTILYFGHFDRNFHRLTVETTTYFDKDDVEKEVEEASKNADGLQFQYMQCRFDEFVAVGVKDTLGSRGVIVLRAPVLLIGERHTDRKGFLNGPHFGEDSAMRLLVDMIIANPEHRDSLGRILRRLAS